jgi:hypothetical protein
VLAVTTAHAQTFTVIHAFTGGADGAGAMAPVVFGPGNLLYGSTINGGNNLNCFGDDYGCGVVFTLQPPQTACHTALCYWISTPIYVFASPTVGLELHHGPFVVLTSRAWRCIAARGRANAPTN